MPTITAMPTPRPVPLPGAFPFHTEVAVRFRDVDAMGHVNNAVYLTFFEEARAALFRELVSAVPEGPSLEKRFPFILAEATCRYLSPVAVGELLRVHLRVSRTGARSFDFDYLITESASGRAVATGRTVQVAFDYSSRRTIEIPGPLKTLLGQYAG